MLAAARRLGASLVLLALVYQGRSVLETRAGGVSEARRALAAANIVTDCTSLPQLSCESQQPSCIAAPNGPDTPAPAARGWRPAGVPRRAWCRGAQPQAPGVDLPPLGGLERRVTGAERRLVANKTDKFSTGGN